MIRMLTDARKHWMVVQCGTAAKATASQDFFKVDQEQLVS